MNDATRGLALGGVGVAIFALTLPMTRLVVGDVAAPQLPPAFVTAGRAALAGLPSVVHLWAVRAPRPSRAQAPALAVGALGTVVGFRLGTVVGFRLGLALALRQVDAMHAAVVTGVLPLAAALVGALVLRVSQVQLLQPFIALLAAWALLGEALRPATLCFTLAVVGVVAVGRRMPVDTPRSKGERP